MCSVAKSIPTKIVTPQSRPTGKNLISPVPPFRAHPETKGRIFQPPPPPKKRRKEKRTTRENHEKIYLSGEPISRRTFSDGGGGGRHFSAGERRGIILCLEHFPFDFRRISPRGAAHKRIPRTPRTRLHFFFFLAARPKEHD